MKHTEVCHTIQHTTTGHWWTGSPHEHLAWSTDERMAIKLYGLRILQNEREKLEGVPVRVVSPISEYDDLPLFGG